MSPAECRGERSWRIQRRVAWRLLVYYHHIYDLPCSHRPDDRQAKLQKFGHYGATRRDRRVDSVYSVDSVASRAQQLRRRCAPFSLSFWPDGLSALSPTLSVQYSPQSLSSTFLAWCLVSTWSPFPGDDRTLVTLESSQKPI
jgi:hypothetical protein